MARGGQMKKKKAKKKAGRKKAPAKRKPIQGAGTERTKAVITIEYDTKGHSIRIVSTTNMDGVLYVGMIQRAMDHYHDTLRRVFDDRYAEKQDGWALAE